MQIIYLENTEQIGLKSRIINWNSFSNSRILGERPSDPLVGFLPPNPENGTSGQGFITYTVRAKDETKTYAVIDAKADIIFDQNEAIPTPPIFNTVGANVQK